MRLSLLEASSLVSALSAIVVGMPWALYLFGSRTNDALKGGDIDLLVILETEEAWAFVSGFKTSILIAMKERVGDQRIDLVFTTEHRIQESAFLQRIRPNAVLLAAFP